MHGGKLLAEVSKPDVVAINGFPTDTPQEVAALQAHCASLGVQAVQGPAAGSAAPVGR